MNPIDKAIMAILSRPGDPNPYDDKSDWSIFDYIIFYGCPLGMLVMFIRMMSSI